MRLRRLSVRSLRQYPFVVIEDGVNWQKVNPQLLAGLNRLGRARGQLVSVTSGYRTYAQQAALYERYKASGFNIKYIAAKPGQSNHETGNAADALINGVPIASAVKASELATYGLRAPVKGDPVHTELAGAAAPAATESGGAGPQQAGVPSGPTPPPGVTSAPPALGTPPAAADPNVELPGTAQHYLPGQGGVAESWQSVAQLPDLSPDTQRLLALQDGGQDAGS